MPRNIFPVFPMIPSTVASRIGGGDILARGPSTGNKLAVVEHPHKSAARMMIQYVFMTGCLMTRGGKPQVS
jgi:hypothetical protein